MHAWLHLLITTRMRKRRKILRCATIILVPPKDHHGHARMAPPTDYHEFAPAPIAPPTNYYTHAQTQINTPLCEDNTCSIASVPGLPRYTVLLASVNCARAGNTETGKDWDDTSREDRRMVT